MIWRALFKAMKTWAEYNDHGRKKMNTKTFADSTVGQFFIRTMASIMESRLRYRFFGPMRVLQGAVIQPGQTILELGCGTGFFTLPGSKLIGDHGSWVAMDILPSSVEEVSRKVQAAHLKNVRVVKGDALNTLLDLETMDVVLLFGVLPAPWLPLDKILPEMHRILRPGGIMAVWPPSWVPQSIPQSGLFTFVRKQNGVFNFKRN
jgi:ubiquinone/menaquinone biosynthesis C-methylase UbiE